MPTGNNSFVQDWQRDQRIYRAFVYIGGAFAFFALVTVVILKNIYTGSSTFLVSKTADPLIFEISIILIGAVFGTAIVGTVFDQYQRRFVARESIMVKKLLGEGIIEVFRSSTDPALLQFMTHLINGARSEMTFIGLGLGILSRNREILSAIGERLNHQQSLMVNIIFGGNQNSGVQNRIFEEEQWHTQNNLSYDSTWVTRYPAEIRSLLDQVVLPAARGRLRVEAAATCPIMTIIKIDDIYLFFSYGPPSIRGSQSPWIALDTNSSCGHLGRFLAKSVEFYT